MDYLKFNPLRDVAKTDETTKKKFANVMSRALFGREAVDLLNEDPHTNSKLKYAGIGINRKLDLCRELRRQANILDNAVKENEELHSEISHYGASLLHKPKIEVESQTLAQQRAQLAAQLQRIEVANLKRKELNGRMNQEISQLIDQMRRERENPESLSKSYLEKVQREFARQNDIKENEIHELRKRRDEAIEQLQSASPLALKQLLASADGRCHTATKEQLQEELKRRQKEYFVFKDEVDSTNAKVSLQVARMRDDLGHKWTTEVEFLSRRVEDYRGKLKQLNSDLLELTSEVAHRKECLAEARERLASLGAPQQTGQDVSIEGKPPSTGGSARKLNLFVDYLAGIFANLKLELDALWAASGRERLPADFGANLGVLMDYINEISSGLDNYKL